MEREDGLQEYDLLDMHPYYDEEDFQPCVEGWVTWSMSSEAGDYMP